jgi:hypothetical protein
MRAHVYAFACEWVCVRLYVRVYVCVCVCVCVRVRVCVYECMRTLNIWHVRVHVPVW